MGWSALLFAEIDLPPGAVEAWKALPVGPSAFADKGWKRSPWMGDPSERTTVAGVLVKLAEHARWCEEELRIGDHQSFRVDGGRISLRASINEDDFRAYAGDIATVLRLAAEVGGRGEYVAVAADDLAGERLVLDARGSRREPVDLMGAMTGGDVPESTLDYAALLQELFATTGAVALRHRAARDAEAAAKAAKKAAKQAAKRR